MYAQSDKFSLFDMTFALYISVEDYTQWTGHSSQNCNNILPVSTFFGGSRETPSTPIPRPQRDPIILFSQTFLLKSSHVRGRGPQGAPPRESTGSNLNPTLTWLQINVLNSNGYFVSFGQLINKSFSSLFYRAGSAIILYSIQNSADVTDDERANTIAELLNAIDTDRNVLTVNETDIPLIGSPVLLLDGGTKNGTCLGFFLQN